MSTLQPMHFRRLDGEPVDVRKVFATFDPHSDLWILGHDFRFVDDAHSPARELLVPQGFTFDLASVPRLLWPVIGAHELSIAAPSLHDILYRNKGRVPGATCVYTRGEADDLFRRVMALAGVPKLRRVAAWLAVRAFGWRAWGS